jgi:quinol monooxygenase YgiN
MTIDRRTFNLGTLAASALVLTDAPAAEPRSATMYGLISQLLTKPEHRDDLVQVLASATTGMPGCLSYVIAVDATRDDAIWITEIWRDRDSHLASLKLPKIRAAMTKGRPLITGFGFRTQTNPVAGI